MRNVDRACTVDEVDNMFDSDLLFDALLERFENGFVFLENILQVWDTCSDFFPVDVTAFRFVEDVFP